MGPSLSAGSPPMAVLGGSRAHGSGGAKDMLQKKCLECQTSRLRARHGLRPAGVPCSAPGPPPDDPGGPRLSQHDRPPATTNPAPTTSPAHHNAIGLLPPQTPTPQRAPLIATRSPSCRRKPRPPQRAPLLAAPPPPFRHQPRHHDEPRFSPHLRLPSAINPVTTTGPPHRRTSVRLHSTPRHHDGPRTSPDLRPPAVVASCLQPSTRRHAGLRGQKRGARRAFRGASPGRRSGTPAGRSPWRARRRLLWHSRHSS